MVDLEMKVKSIRLYKGSQILSLKPNFDLCLYEFYLIMIVLLSYFTSLANTFWSVKQFTGSC